MSEVDPRGTAPEVKLYLNHNWQVEVVPGMPMISPTRSYVYPRAAEEIERGALLLNVTPERGAKFFAVCALGYSDPAVPTGVWSCPDPDWMCAVAGGYAYIINTAQPKIFEWVSYRPVMGVLALPAHNLLLFTSHYSVLAWGRDGKAWESGRLSSEGVVVTGIDGDLLRGRGWDMRTDEETEWALDLKTGERAGL